MDLHQGQIQGFFSIPVDELTAVDMLAKYVTGLGLEDLVVVSELGFAEGPELRREPPSAPLAIVEKRRQGNDDRAS